MAYVPPALRRMRQSAAEGENGNCNASKRKSFAEDTDSNLPSIRDIQKYFWPTGQQAPEHRLDNVPNQEKDNTNVSVEVSHSQSPETNSTVKLSQLDEPTPDGQSAIDSDPKSRVAHPHRTLNSTEAENDKLKYILLFQGANPQWKDDHIIYVKSDLHLLPILPNDVVPSLPSQDPKPLVTGVLIFEQTFSPGSRSQQNSRFNFLGYHSLANMQLLEPNSPDLIRMLEQKWTRTSRSGRSGQIARDAASWKKSLSYRWAVLKFQKDDEMTSKLGPPKIEISNDNSGQLKGGRASVASQPRKSVNEMLKDLRLEDRKGGNDDGVDNT